MRLHKMFYVVCIVRKCYPSNCMNFKKINESGYLHTSFSFGENITISSVIVI
jgi:hypothetical protein